ncbi:MAG: prepilin-type N-terminal cleavage/methylation domain-containing protein [Pseudoxanthomonas sp.]|nr:prepilin-type N-terminal cleavage/methylation domain-containing protein [Pseudoxanthomonas sp.]
MTHSLRPIARSQRGFTLVELMLAMLLGLLVAMAAGGIFLSNRRTYGSTEAINRIQENQRTAFELMARDIREAGANPCIRFSASVQPVMQIVAPDTEFWSRFPGGIHGDDGTGANGSDAVTVYSDGGTSYSVGAHKKPGDVLTVDSGTTGLTNGQVLMVCNTSHAIAFIASGITSGGTTVGHDSTSNCGKGLTLSPDATKCTATESGPGYCFWLGAAATAADTLNCPAGIGASPAFVVTPVSVSWSVAANGRGGNSLYRTVGGTASEIAEGVNSLDISYKIGAAANYVSAADVTAANAWSLVSAVRVQMAIQAVQGALSSGDTRGTGGVTLSRNLDDYIVLRNHQDIQ